MNGSPVPSPLAALWMMSGQQPPARPEAPAPSLSPSDLALTWLHLSMQDPRTLSPESLAIRERIHGILNQRMLQDPYGMPSFMPPGPSITQQMQRRWQPVPPMTPDLEHSLVIPPGNGWLKGAPQDAPWKSGVTPTPEGLSWQL